MAALLVKLFANKEIRRFQLELESDGVVRYAKLANKIAQLYPGVADQKVTWKDDEGDMVSITNDEELNEAWGATKDGLLRVYLLSTGNLCAETFVEEEQHVVGQTIVHEHASNKSKIATENKEETEPQDKIVDPTVHTGVTCDGCNGEVKGLRYKCLICHNYDLCETCKANSTHSDHHTICIPSPNDKSWMPSFVSYRIPFFPPPHNRMHHHRCAHKQDESQQQMKEAEPQEKSPSVDTETNGQNKETLHSGITCDGCKGPVDGMRYKCLTCFNFDLCDACHGKNVHPEHAMLCIISPKDHSWRRAFIHRRFPAFVHRRFLGGIPSPWNVHPGCQRSRCRMCNHENGKENGNDKHGEKIAETVQASIEKMATQDAADNADVLGSIIAKVIGDVILPMFMGPLSSTTQAVQDEIRKDVEAKNVQSENVSEERNENVSTSVTDDNVPTSIHIGVMCDGCNNGPINGMRFKCLICPDFDLCEPCESKRMHVEHPMVRIGSTGDKSWHRMFQRHHKHRCTKKFDIIEQQQRKCTKLDLEETQPKDPEENIFNGFVDLMAAAVEAFGKECLLQEKEKKESQVDALNKNSKENEVKEKSANAEVKSDSDVPNSFVAKSLEHMLAMGFTNENGWLKELLAQKNGDICAVLDMFKPRRF